MHSPATRHPEVVHPSLATTFRGVLHPLSTEDVPIHQFRGVKYASVPARFRQSKLCTSYPSLTDATKYGPICPQVKKHRAIEDELFGPPAHDIHRHAFEQNEFECLNLNITRPAGVPIPPQLPVMVWIHGGGDRGSGSSWAYDGGSIVHQSVVVGKPIIMVTLNFRIGLLGFAASPALQADNAAAGDAGVGNYGLHDQRQALQWISSHISAFGGSPSNITLFGSSTGAADIVCHLLSTYNETNPLFHRAILQSPMIDPCPPTVHTAGSNMSRLLCHLNGNSAHKVESLRHFDVDSIVKLGWTTRATDDGVWFREGWQSWFEDGRLKTTNKRPSARRSKSRTAMYLPTHTHLPGNLQAIIIGDSTPSFSTSPLSRHPSSLMSLWTPSLLTRRLKAVCQSLAKASRILRAYDLDPSQSESYGGDDDIEEYDQVEDRVRELVHDARIGWPTERIANGAKIERGGRGVWRYVFDEEGVEDVRCFFDCAKVDPVMHTMTDLEIISEEDTSSSEGSEEDDYSDDGVWGDDASSPFGYASPYSLVRDALQSRWLTFAYGEAPWSEEGVYVFGPEGETGERSGSIFEGRRKREVWKETFEPVGMAMIHKIGAELTRGPGTGGVGMTGVAGGFKI